MTEIFPVAVPPTVIVRVRFWFVIVVVVRLNVSVAVGVKFVTTVVPFSAIEFVFRIVFGSVTAHAKEFVAPAAELKFAGGVHVIASGDCVEVGVVVIAAVAGSNAIAPAAFVTAEASVTVAFGADKVARFGAVVDKFSTETEKLCVTFWRVTETLKFPLSGATSVLGRTARTVIVEEVGVQSTKIFCCIATGILFVTEIFPVAVPPTEIFRVRFVLLIVVLVGLKVSVGVRAVTTGLNVRVAVASRNRSVATKVPVAFVVAGRVTTPALEIAELFESHEIVTPPAAETGKGERKFPVTSFMSCPLEIDSQVKATAAEFTACWSAFPVLPHSEHATVPSHASQLKIANGCVSATP